MVYRVIKEWLKGWFGAYNLLKMLEDYEWSIE